MPYNFTLEPPPPFRKSNISSWKLIQHEYWKILLEQIHFIDISWVSIQRCKFNLCITGISHKTFANKHHFHPTSQKKKKEKKKVTSW